MKHYEFNVYGVPEGIPLLLTMGKEEAHHLAHEIIEWLNDDDDRTKRFRHIMIGEFEDTDQTGATDTKE